MSIVVPLDGFGGGGGAALNFKVIGNPQPETPPENTIWVNTDTKITGYVFAAAAPSNPVEGMVWILTGVSSPVEFNPLKKNIIMVYPMSAQQYVGGAWVDKTAKTWKGNAWTDWATWLYDSGNEFTDLTGGWELKTTSKEYTATSGSVLTKNDDSMYVKNVTNGSRRAVSVNKIDLTPYKEIRMIFSGKQGYIGVADEIPTSTITATARADGDETFSEKTEMYLDISTVNKSQFVLVGDGNVKGAYVYKVWLV